ncbi:conserved membrane hypothetical protein [Magnetospirillum molischianum DSM 120]|uniref:Integral membrane protein n=2 Tax=Magnetospirillum molischianum TaxID=1083 RepID=H8FQ57_MAGML|nr:conserved membrane hypothetical protein [Magnetospirillum molischianum DSM 120]
MVGAMVLGLGLFAVWVFDLVGRRAASLDTIAAAAKRVALLYDAVVVPGALLIMASGGWTIVTIHGSSFLEIPWLAGMVILFSLEFVEGNTITRLFFLRLRRTTAAAAADPHGQMPDVQRSFLPSFTHFLDIPVFVLIMSLGIFKPTEWSVLILGCVLAVAVALAQTIYFIPRLNGQDGH